MDPSKSNIDFPGKYFRVGDHDLRFVSRSKDRLDAVLQVISCARKSIRMCSYIFRDDRTGTEVMKALLAACKRGLQVDLMIDSFGSADAKGAFFSQLEKAGGRFHYFSSRWNLGYFIRNHQKILIADDAHILIGGFNITDRYFGRTGEDSWEDFGVIVSGPHASDLAGYYDDMVGLCGDGGVRFGQLRRLVTDWQTGNDKLQWLLGGPTNRISPWALSLKRDLTGADSVHLVAAYFSPSQSILRRIAKITRKGDSRLIMAGKSDNGATIGAARALYKYLLKRGANIFEFERRPLHKKLFLIDDATYVGSANLDIRSLFINMEIMLRIDDADVAAYIRGDIDEMAQDSIEQTLESHRKRNGLWSRIKNGFAFLIVNTLDYTIGRRIKFGLLKKD